MSFKINVRTDWFQWFERKVPCCWTPIELLNCCGVVYTLSAVFALLLVNGWFTCPAVNGRDGCDGPLTVGYFILFEIFANLFCFHWCSRRNRLGYLFPARLRHDEGQNEFTKFCYSCSEAVPRRSHHCPLCRYCVLRKDHHCFMTGGCVGFGNQRYFIGFLLWAAIGAAYSTLYAFRYLNRFYQPFLPFGWINYIAPIALKRWIFFQHCSLFQLCVTVVFSVGIASTCGAVGFFVVQVFFVVKGTTMWDYSTRKSPAETRLEAQTLPQRLRLVLGPYWLLNVLLPMPWLKNELEPQFVRTLYEYYMKEL